MSDENPDNNEPEATDIQIDGIWRVEGWHARFLVVRYVPLGEAGAQRQVLSEGKFSAFALVYEDEATAQAVADLKNGEAEAPASPPQETQQ